MHKEILSENQLELLPLVKQFGREFYLVGGTAIALHIGHRRSIDFDLFKFTSFNAKKIISKISVSPYQHTITRRVTEQLNITIYNVKFTFFQFPFEIEIKAKFENIIKLPELLDLAAMKAYALGRRSKWKDYVDLYFILKSHYTFEEISKKATGIFGQMFSEKLFRAQLSYFDDIDYSEPVDFVTPPVSEDDIKQFLVEKTLEVNL